MNQNWTYKKLGEICEISAGQGAPQGEDKYCDDGIPFVKAGNIEDLLNGLDEYKIQKVNDSVAKSHKLKLYKAGSVVFAKSGMSCMKGLVYTLKNDCFVVSHLAILTPKDVMSSFLNYTLNFYNPNTLVKDEAYPSISLADISNHSIPVPPLSTQSRIVSELDLLQSLIDKQKAQLKEYDTLAQSIFYDMFGDPVENEKGWEVKKLGEIALVKIGPFGSLLHTSDYISGGIPLVNPIHMKNGYIKPDYGFTISEEKKKEMLPYLLKKGDVVFARRGEIGRCAIVSEKEDGYLCGTGSLFVRFIKPISEVFVLYLTKSDSFIKDLVSKAKGATMLNINCKIVEDLRLTIPPQTLQQSFANKIEAIERQKSAISKSIAETEKLFEYTMDKYFG